MNTAPLPKHPMTEKDEAVELTLYHADGRVEPGWRVPDDTLADFLLRLAWRMSGQKGPRLDDMYTDTFGCVQGVLLGEIFEISLDEDVAVMVDAANMLRRRLGHHVTIRGEKYNEAN